MTNITLDPKLVGELIKVVAVGQPLLDYSNDLANWNNQDPNPSTGDTHYLSVTVVTNGPTGLARMFEGNVVGTTKTFLGRADQWLFVAHGTLLSTEVDGVLRKADFAWISAPEGGEAVLRWLIPPSTGFSTDPPAAQGKEGVRIKNIRLVDGLLMGLGHDPATDQPVKCIISFQKIKFMPPIVK